MQVDLNQRLTFPSEISVTSLCPDLVLWSSSSQHVFIVELMVPWEDTIDTCLAAEAEEWGWKVKVCPVEVGCRGFVAKSTVVLLYLALKTIETK